MSQDYSTSKRARRAARSQRNKPVLVTATDNEVGNIEDERFTIRNGNTNNRRAKPTRCAYTRACRTACKETSTLLLKCKKERGRYRSKRGKGS